MGKSTTRGAIVGATIALIYLGFVRAFPDWGIAIFCVTVGLIALALFVRLYLREPPSLERFRWLSAYGLAAVSALILAPVVAILKLPLQIDRIDRLMILSGVVGVLLVGMFVFTIWHAIAVRNYSPEKHGNPDFEEDVEGNPVRRNDPRGKV
jgi:hypothetical protein